MHLMSALVGCRCRKGQWLLADRSDATVGTLTLIIFSSVMRPSGSMRKLAHSSIVDSIIAVLSHFAPPQTKQKTVGAVMHRHAGRRVIDGGRGAGHALSLLRSEENQQPIFTRKALFRDNVRGCPRLTRGNNYVSLQKHMSLLCGCLSARGPFVPDYT